VAQCLNQMRHRSRRFHFQKIHKVCHACVREKCTVQQAISRISSNRKISLRLTKVFIQLRYALLILHTAHCKIQGVRLKTEPAHMVSINVYSLRGAFLLNRGTRRRRAYDITAACRPTTPPALQCSALLSATLRNSPQKAVNN